MGDTDPFGDEPSNLDIDKLRSKMQSLEETKNNINSSLWNAKTDYYLSQGEVGATQLDELKRKKITDDFNIRKTQYENLMNYLYDKYYDKLAVLYAQKNMTNKQIEIINNTQYKILEQRDVDNNLTNELTTKNREREYSNTIYRKQLRDIKIYSYVLGCFFFLIIIVLVLNLSSFTEQGFPEKFYGVLNQSNKKISLIYLVIVLILIIVFRQFSLAILFLVVYAIITLLTDFPEEMSFLNNAIKYT